MSAFLLIGPLACSSMRPLVAAPTTQVERTVSKLEAPASIELAEVHVSLREDGTWKRVQKTRYEILDRSALDSWGATQARYSPWFTKKPVIDVRVTNLDGEGKRHEYVLDPSVLTEEPAYPQAPDVYGDTRVLRAPLPNMQLGSVVEETITTESHRTFLHASYLHRGYFDSNVPVKKARFIVDAPSGMALKFKVFDAKVQRSESKQGDRVVVTYEGGPFAGLEPLDDTLPPDVVRWPNVAVVAGADWEQLAGSYEEVVEKALKGIDFRSAIAGVVSAADPARVKVSKLLQWLKDRVRYVGVEFGDAAIVPYAPDKTIARGFGDCKDQATLLVGLLRAAGLQAEVALLYAEHGEDLAPDLPALNVFNHAIVHVSAPEELYIDPTGDFFTVGNLPTSDQGRYVLVAGGPHAGLRRTPEPEAEKNTYEEVRTFRFKPAGPVDIQEVSRGTGYFDWELRSAFSVPEERLNENLENYVESNYHAESVSGIEHTDPLDLSKAFVGTLVAEKASSGQTDLLEAWGDVNEAPLFRWLPHSLLEGEEPRKAPLYLHAPYVAKLVWNVVPPQGFVVSAPPVSTTVDFGAAKLERRVESKADGSLGITAQLVMKQARLSVEDVMKFREAYASWRQGNVPRAVLRHRAWDLAQQGKIIEAVASLRAATNSGDVPALAKLRMSRILRPSLEDLSLAQADEATQLAPNDVDVWRHYADFVASNAAGEDLGKGFARERALRAYRKVYELDPKQTYAKLRHAVVLEHDADGERYQTPQKDLLEAVSIYDSIPSKELREYEKGAFRSNVLYALYWAGQYDELAKRLAALTADEAPQGLVVMSAAARAGAEAALETADALHLEAASRSEILQAASRTLVLSGDYVGAAKVLDAIRAEGEDARALQRRVSMLRGLVRTNESDLPEGTASELTTKMLTLAVIRDEKDTGFATRYLAKGAQVAGKNSQLGAAIDRLRQDLPAGVTKQFMLDLMSHGYKAVVDGNDRVGFRVKVSFEYGQTNSTVFYLVKEAGKLKVRAMTGLIGELGAGAWEAIDAGNQAQAKQWLDWAREVLLVSGQEDALRIPPFGRLWNEGKGDLKAAAAALAASSDRAESVVPYLERRLAAAKTDDEKQIFLHALVNAQHQLKRHTGCLDAARALSKLAPDSKLARSLLLMALWDTENFSEYQGLVESALKAAKTSDETREFQGRLASVLSHRGKFAEAQQIHRKAIESTPGAADQLNSLAWLGLFVGPSQNDVDLILRSLELQRSAARLHTLACLYADLGRIDEAGKTLGELRKLRPGRALQPHDWYIVGRVAEHLGFLDEAKRAYREVTKPQGESATSTYSLAQRRSSKL